MREDDHKKLLAAGFTIFRVDRSELKIKIKSGSHAWKTYKKCFTPADLAEQAAEMRKHPRNIED